MAVLHVLVFSICPYSQVETGVRALGQVEQCPLAALSSHSVAYSSVH